MKNLAVILLSIILILSVACSSVPLPVGSADHTVTLAKPVGLSGDTLTKKSALQPPKIQPLTENLQLAREIPLQATASNSVSIESASVETVDAIELSLTAQSPRIRKQSLRPKDRVQLGIKLLKKGKISAARNEFENALKSQKNNKTANYMLRQIQLPPQQYFARFDFTSRYQVQAGDTFSTIASQFLGNSLDFHSLTKLNKRKNSEDLKVGDIILVPLAKQTINNDAKFDTKSVDTESRKSVLPHQLEYNVAKKYFEQGQYPSSIALLAAKIAHDKKDTKSRELLVSVYSKYADVLENQGKLSAAQSILAKAIAIQPNNRKLQKHTALVEKQRKADKHYQTGLKALSKGKDFDAFSEFEKTLLLFPDNEKARNQLIRLKPNVTKFLHDKAMLLYKDQKIKAAIGKWDRVLMIDSEHELARLYRGRAIELQKRLDKLPKNF